MVVGCPFRVVEELRAKPLALAPTPFAGKEASGPRISCHERDARHKARRGRSNDPRAYGKAPGLLAWPQR